MDILEQKKREIERQYDTIRASILSERKMRGSGVKSSSHLLEEKDMPSENHIITESRRVFEEHSNNSVRGKYLGRLKIFTPDGARIFPCSCSAFGNADCGNHEQRTHSNRKGEDTLRFEKSLASVRSQKCLLRLASDEVASVRSGGKQLRRGIEPSQPLTSSGSSRFPRESQIDSDPYGFLSSLHRQKMPLPQEQILLKGRPTQNCCSFCLKKCDSLTCQSCQRLKLRR